MNKKKKIKKCLYCRKDFLSYKYQNRKFCSNKCNFKYFKKHKISAFYNLRIQSMNGHASQRILKREGRGFHDPKVRKKNNETCKRLKLGAFYNPKIHNKICKKAGLNSIKSQRENKPYYFHKVPFDSNFEREIGMNISYQLNIKLKEGINCHVIVGGKEIDFFIRGCFIEPHPINYFFNKYYKNDKDYYLKRRKILDENGYKKYKLIVIK